MKPPVLLLEVFLLEKQMKIKILRCSDSMLWYNRHIGEVMQVVRITPDQYWCKEPNEYGCLNFVLIKDCEVYSEG